MAEDLVGVPRAPGSIGVAAPVTTREAGWRALMSCLGGGAFAVQDSAHGSAPVMRADHDASARAAAFGVQSTSHASAALIAVAASR
jgi:hypothetical protein